jgi:chromosome segregation ATPase
MAQSQKATDPRRRHRPAEIDTGQTSITPATSQPVINDKGTASQLPFAGVDLTKQFSESLRDVLSHTGTLALLEWRTKTALETLGGVEERLRGLTKLSENHPLLKSAKLEEASARKVYQESLAAEGKVKGAFTARVTGFSLQLTRALTHRAISPTKDNTAEIDALNSRITSLQTETAANSHDIQALQSSVATMQTRTASKSDYTGLTQSVEALQWQLQEINKNHQSTWDTLRNDQKLEIERLAQENSALKVQIASAQKESESHKSALKERIQKLQNESESAKSKTQTLESRLKELENKVNADSRAPSQPADLSDEIKKAVWSQDGRISSLNDSYNAMLVEVGALKGKLTEHATSGTPGYPSSPAEMSLRNARGDVDQLKQAMNHAETHRRTLGMRCQHTEHAIKVLSSRYDNITTDKIYHSLASVLFPQSDQLRADVARVQQMVHNMQLSTEKLCTVERMLVVLKGEQHRVDEIFESTNAKITEVQKHLEQHVSSTAEMPRTLAEIEAKLQDEERRSKELEEIPQASTSNSDADQIAELRASVEDIRGQLKEVSDHAIDAGKLKTQLHNRVDEINNLSQSFETGTADLLEAKTKLDELSHQVDELQNNVSTLTTDVAEVKTKTDDAVREGLTTYDEKLQAVKESIARSEKTAQDASGGVDALKDSVGRMATSRAVIEAGKRFNDGYTKLSTDLEALRHVVKDNHVGLQDSLEKLDQKFENKISAIDDDMLGQFTSRSAPFSRNASRSASPRRPPPLPRQQSSAYDTDSKGMLPTKPRAVRQTPDLYTPDGPRPAKRKRPSSPMRLETIDLTDDDPYGNPTPAMGRHSVQRPYRR